MDHSMYLNEWMNETCQINDDILKAWTDFQRNAPPQKDVDIIERKKKEIMK